MGNNVAMGDTNFIPLQTGDVVAGGVLVSRATFSFSGNSFDGGTGTNTLDLSGVLGASAKIDVAAGKLYISDSPGNVMKNFQTFIGTTSDDTYIDGKGNQTYSDAGGADRFTFTRGHGADTVSGFSTDDFLILKGFGAKLNSFAKLLAKSTETSPGVIHIDTTDGGSLDLYGITKAQLQADHVFFA